MLAAADIRMLTQHADSACCLRVACSILVREGHKGSDRKHLLDQRLQGAGSIWELCAGFNIGQLKRNGRLGQQPCRSSRQAPFGRQNLPWSHLS